MTKLAYENGRISWGNDAVANIFGTSASASLQDNLGSVRNAITTDPESLEAPAWVQPVEAESSTATKTTGDTLLEKFVNLFSLPGDSTDVQPGTVKDVGSIVQDKLQDIVVRSGLLLLAVLILAIGVYSFARG